MQKPDDALEHFEQSIRIFTSYIRSSPADITQFSETIGMNHQQISGILLSKGDYETSVHHAHESERIREKLLGAGHPKTIESYEQIAACLTAQWLDYNGVITDKIRKQLLLALYNWEKVFKYQKLEMKRGKGKTLRPSKTQHGKDMMGMTKTLVRLKFKLLSTEQRELIRDLKTMQIEPSDEVMRETVMHLIQLIPTTYTEELLQRLEVTGDDEAKMGMAALLQIADLE